LANERPSSRRLFPQVTEVIFKGTIGPFHSKHFISLSPNVGLIHGREKIEIEWNKEREREREREKTGWETFIYINIVRIINLKIKINIFIKKILNEYIK